MTDKSGLIDFASGLVRLGFDIVSTGGTAKALREAGIQVTDVQDVTGFPPMLDGRVKTLHPMIHGGLLGDLRSPDHRDQMDDARIRPIEVACVNLYAFEQTVKSGCTLEEAVESIDIGGPAMVRAAAKNFANVTVVVDPDDYGRVLSALESDDVQDLRKGLAAKAFRHTAFYDSLVSRYLTEDVADQETLTLGWRSSPRLRYGENPHQSASLYVDPLTEGGVAQAKKLWGKDMSYINVLDAAAAWELVCDLPEGSCVVIKHANPCGAASLGDLAASYVAAKASDPVSSFGGIVGLNGVVDARAAEAMTSKGNFLEVVVARGFDPEALDVFRERSGWGQDVRLLEAVAAPATPFLSVRSVRGGLLVQDSDEDFGAPWTCATAKEPSAEETEALRLAWTLVRHVGSNAIVVASKDRLLGVGAGQMNRVQSVRLALDQAGEGAKGAVLASDAFFPFPDSIETAAAAGIVAVVQPGGSKKDPDVIAKADELGLAMMLTGVRHFRH